MGRSKSSSRWMREHFEDEFVKKARQQGYRSRAVYKLQELDEKYRFFCGGRRVVDLGAAPGGWSQYAAMKVGDSGQVIASDILAMDAIAGVQFIQGDFKELEVCNQIVSALRNCKADLVTSDMAPNISGVDAVDIPRAMYLVELASDLAAQVLAPKGTFICKLFQGEGSDQWLKQLRQSFDKVIIKKPKASRPRSREVYIIAAGFKS